MPCSSTSGLQSEFGVHQTARSPAVGARLRANAAGKKVMWGSPESQARCRSSLASERCGHRTISKIRPQADSYSGHETVPVPPVDIMH